MPGLIFPTVPHGFTALRPSWSDLPEVVQRFVVGRVGPIQNVHVAGGGYTSTFAGMLTALDGSRHFVKAAALDTRSAGWLQREADVISALPDGVLAPRVQWVVSDQGWFVLCLEPIDGRMPQQPWRAEELTAVLNAQVWIARVLADPPARLRGLMNVPSFSEHAAEELTCWLDVASGVDPMPDTPAWVADRVPELVALESALPSYTSSADGVVHFDLRADNILLTPDGRIVVCDWNWARSGPGWTDTVMLLASAVPDHDVEALLAHHPSMVGVTLRAVDSLLAALAGHGLVAGAGKVVATSPYLRDVQRASGLRALIWLAARRGWVTS